MYEVLLAMLHFRRALQDKKKKKKKKKSFIEQTNMPNSFSALKHKVFILI